MTIRKVSLRKSLWTGDKASARDVAEFARDVDQRVRSVETGATLQVVSFDNFTFTLPIVIDTAGRKPAAVYVGTLRVPGSPTNLQPTLTPLWDVWNGKVRINQITGATVGTKYDLSLLLFYAGT